MKHLLAPALAIARKDLYAEWKTKQTITTMLIFSGLVILTFSFAFDPSNQAVSALVPGMIWVITIFAGILGLNRSFTTEKQHDHLHGMMVAPVDPSGIYIGKFLANLVFVLVVQVVSIPLLFLLFDFQVPAYSSIFYFLLIIFLGTFGFIAVGTLLAALASHAKSSEMLLPILLFPLVTPVIIAAVQATRLVLTEQEGAAAALSWMQLMGAYDVIFFAAGFLLFEYVLEV
ncbi:heme exporter protein CcmB [Salipaludibacillus sp. CUR1]|uniref:heme exporter protein CcmB n=1 Tax=Salipaludibacillus sp. CUR1 TaxID=2820003 RepID=UPI001E5A50C3|nr:heme exporter protein CcmB [Salipaludibacillus sp. CUR1]MCE7792811.1 heme exporter protein CcmB [Salipaludibacillus sp. CUR1]